MFLDAEKGWCNERNDLYNCTTDEIVVYCKGNPVL